MNPLQTDPTRPSLPPRLHIFVTCLLSLLLASCASKVGVVEKRLPITYDAYPKSSLNSKGYSTSTDEVLHSNNLARLSQRDPALAIAGLDHRPADSATRLARAEVCLSQARSLETLRPDDAVAWYLAAAEQAWPTPLARESSPDEKTHAAIYTHSTGQIAALLFDRGHDFTRPATFTSPGRTYTLVTDITGPSLSDPRRFDYLVPADQLEIRGMRCHIVQEGLGAPLAGHRGRIADSATNDPFLAPAGMALPVTATLEFEGNGRVVLRYHEVLSDDSARLAGKSRQLAADFTAPLAALMTQAHSLTKLKFKALLDPSIMASRTGLYFLEPFHRDRIPVVLVHGLMSDPATWLDPYNELLADPVIRENYQFWYFVYPTGNPVGVSGAALRSEFDQMKQVYPSQYGRGKFNDMVLIGHSMGGLVSNLQIREGGDSLWFKVSKVPLDDLKIDENTREEFRRSAYFHYNPHIRRVIFASAPHRGSELANKPLVELATKLINAPFSALNLEAPQLLGQMTSTGQAILQAGFTGVSTLRLNDPRLLANLDQPVSPRVTYHSIIGNQGKPGPLEESSDGVVPYFSAHLEGAASEKIVPSGHGSHQHPEGVAEIHRILLLHLGR